MCLDTYQRKYDFVILNYTHHDYSTVVCARQRCVCVNTWCSFIIVGELLHYPVHFYNSFCKCNFTKLYGCDLDFIFPDFLIYVLLQNYELYYEMIPVLEGMNLQLIQQLLSHDDLQQLLTENANQAQRVMIKVQHDGKQTVTVLGKIKKTGNNHHWKHCFIGHPQPLVCSI